MRPFDDDYIWNELLEADRFVRDREFSWADGRWWIGSMPPIKVWPARSADRDDRLRLHRDGQFRHPQFRRGEGHEHIHVVEIIRSRTLGKIAVYRQWITDPDGNEFVAPFLPKASKLLLRVESRLRGTLNMGRYVEVVEKKPVRPPPRLTVVERTEA